MEHFFPSFRKMQLCAPSCKRSSLGLNPAALRLTLIMWARQPSPKLSPSDTDGVHANPIKDAQLGAYPVRFEHAPPRSPSILLGEAVEKLLQWDVKIRCYCCTLKIICPCLSTSGAAFAALCIQEGTMYMLENLRSHLPSPRWTLDHCPLTCAEELLINNEVVVFLAHNVFG